jgi:hypothetical protein
VAAIDSHTRLQSVVTVLGVALGLTVAAAISDRRSQQ